MKVLFIGGTGVISSACSELAIKKGIELYLLNRGKSARTAPEEAKILIGDISDKNSVENALGDHQFDVVVNWIAFTPEQIENDLEIFRERTKQYIFISSASAYQTPPANLPITESTPLYNPFWQYSRDKIACEERLMRAYREEDFPVTIVRPSHTYDETKLPFWGRYTVVDRMLKGKKVVVHGDGTSLWALTNHGDFAKGFVGILGNNHAIGEAFHITSDEILTWNQIFEIVGNAFGTKPEIVHIPSEIIAKYDEEWGAGLLGDKAHSMIFDNSKIKKLVPDFSATIPFSRGAEEIAKWFNEDDSRKFVEERIDKLFDKVIADWEKLW